MFTNYSLKQKLLLKNRVVMAPMTTWASNDDYTISDQEVAYYERRNHGVGMIITGCTQVQENGIGFTHEFASYDDSFIPSLTKLATAAKSKGAPAILQIFHAGNKALPELAGDVVSSSSVKTESTGFVDSYTPRELTEEEIWTVIKAFGETTRRAIEAGFDGVEIHGAHGFLIQQFLSPYFNRRNDAWGGNLTHRTRFALEVVKEVKRIIEASGHKDFVLGYRLSADEHYKEGLRVTDTLLLVEELAALDVDYIHLSLGEAYADKPKGYDETYVSLFAKKIAGRMALIAAGGVQNYAQAKEILAQGADLVAIGHALITDPQWVEKIQLGQADIQLHLDAKLVKELSIPDRLWHAIKNMGDWFKIIE